MNPVGLECFHPKSLCHRPGQNDDPILGLPFTMRLVEPVTIPDLQLGMPAMARPDCMRML